MSKFDKPKDVSDIDIAFPAKVSHLMPPMASIPDEFKRFSGEWVEFQRAWFYGHRKIASVTPKDGIDASAAIRHLHCIQGSFEPKHEHKEAAVAYLASLWFDGVTYADEVPA